MDIGTVRQELANAGSTVVLPIGALTCDAYVPDAVAEPHFFVAEYEIDFDQSYGRSLDEAEFTCRVLVGRGDDLSAQKTLDLMLSGSGPASLKAALEAARGAPGQAALNGAADDLHVRRIQGYRWYEHAGTQYVGAELLVRVIGSGA